MKALVFKGDFSKLKEKRFVLSSKDPFVDCKVVQRGIGKGLNILIYETGEIRMEINGFIAPGANQIEESIKKMELEYEVIEL